MRVLFVPGPAGGPAHLIPLVVLARMLSSVEWCFLLPSNLRPLARVLGIAALDLDHQPFGAQGFRTEMRAYQLFRPNVVVDDTCFTTGFATTLAQLPRVTIQRTGVFPTGRPRNPQHQHSMGLDLQRLPDVTMLGLAQPGKLSDLFIANAQVVPGIPSIELLPAALREDPSYFFAGPLLLEDEILAKLDSKAERAGAESPTPFAALERFLDEHAGRPRVLVTYGTVAEPPEAMISAIRELVESGVAVVSTIRNLELDQNSISLYHYAERVPLHLVTSRVNLAIHQCGSGTYQYPLLHRVPAITIGTQCFDREDVAVRLQELGLSRHLAGPQEDCSFTTRFRATVAEQLALSEDERTTLRARFDAIQREIARTQAAFDFQKVLSHAISRQARKARPRLGS